VIRFEQRGCGRSAPAPSYTLEGCLEDLETVRQFYGVEQWFIAGHSWGADLALLYALHFPQRVHGLVCIAGGRIHNDREWHQAYEAGKAQEREIPPLFAFPPNMVVNEQLGRAWKQYIQRPTLLTEIAALERPALFLYGDRDIRPSWPMQQVANLLPQGQFVMLEGADHHPWLTHRSEIQAALVDFLQ
jgi:proline iminopeptidase